MSKNNYALASYRKKQRLAMYRDITLRVFVVCITATVLAGAYMIATA